jgi:two-component SAPR family response regulator
MVRVPSHEHVVEHQQLLPWAQAQASEIDKLLNDLAKQERSLVATEETISELEEQKTLDEAKALVSELKEELLDDDDYQEARVQKNRAAKAVRETTAGKHRKELKQRCKLLRGQIAEAQNAVFARLSGRLEVPAKGEESN